MPFCPRYRRQVYPGLVLNEPVEGSVVWTKTRYRHLPKDIIVIPTGSEADCLAGKAAEKGKRGKDIAILEEGVCHGCGLSQTTTCSADKEFNNHFTKK